MEFRLLEKADIGRAALMLRECFKEMDFASRCHIFDIEACQLRLAGCIDNGMFSVIGAFIEDELAGMVVCALVPGLMSNEELKCVEVVWHTDPSMSRFARAKLMMSLFLCMMEIAESRKATSVHVGIPCDVENGLSDFLKKNGFAASETCFVKQLTYGT